MFSAGAIDRVDDPALVVVTPESIDHESSADATDDGSGDETQRRRYGWLVDTVGVTEPIEPADIQPVRTSARLIRGRVDLEDGPATLLDERVIHPQP